jgi:general secretion pathway protein C
LRQGSIFGREHLDRKKKTAVRNMLDTLHTSPRLLRTSARWPPPRLPPSAPDLVSLGLTVLIVLEVIRTVPVLLGSTPAMGTVPSAVRLTQVRKHSPIDSGAIAAAHLFGTAAVTANRNPATAPPTTANLVLAGTLATDNPKHGFAIIVDAGPSKVYAVGDAVGTASLHSVYLDHVILDRGGNLESLALPRPAADAARRQSARVPPGPSAADPGRLAELMRLGASVNNEAGKLHGLSIYPGKSRAAFERTGLSGGDLVIAVNGAALENRDRHAAQEMFAAIKTASQATLTVERNGQTHDVTLDASQVY